MSPNRFARNVGLAVVAAVIAVASAGSAPGDGLAATDGPPLASVPSVRDQVGAAPTLVFECFQLYLGQDPNKTLMLVTDNFGKDIVTVRTSDMVCESAYKYRQVPVGTKPAPPTVHEALQCFRLQNGQDPNDPAVLDTLNFGPDGVRVRTSTRMCESAVKLRPGLPPFGEVPQPRAWQCFNIQNGHNPNVQVVLSTNNFGAHRAFVRQAVLMCETAAKYIQTAAGEVQLSIPNEEQQVYECFRLIETPFQLAPATLITKNFGNDEVRIGRANLMCEPAKKTILFDHPDPNDPIPDGLGAD